MSLPGSSSRDQIRTLKLGKIFGGRWRVLEKLGEGGMGAVYKVEDKSRKNFYGAMKLEDDLYEGGVLKLEVYILQKLRAVRHTVRLYDSGRTNRYCFMVMSLLGKDLLTLKYLAGRPFSEATTLRLAISTLYSIKQVHEVGYVHRDIKPGNFLIGRVGRDKRMTYLIDYGMARSFVAMDESTGQLALRKPRDGKQLFRGTPRYCSLNTHYRKEQTCPEEFQKIHAYLTTLKYEDRPDYYGLYSECWAGLKRVHGSFLDRYEWETETDDEENTAISIVEDDRRTLRPAGRTKLAQKMYPFASTAAFKENVLNL